MITTILQDVERPPHVTHRSLDGSPVGIIWDLTPDYWQAKGFTVFGMTWPGIKPTTSQGKHWADHNNSLSKINNNKHVSIWGIESTVFNVHI